MVRLVGSLAACLVALGLLPGAVVAQTVLISTDYPAVTVDPGGTATFPLTVTTPTPERVDLAVATAPPDWETRLRGSGSTISAVHTGEEPPEVALEVNVPATVAPGSYEIVLEARSATASSSLRLDVTVEAVEQGAVEMTAQYPVLRGRAGQTYRFDLSLRNGTNEERTFTLETEGTPPGWRIDARPQGQEQAATAVVAAGSTARITVEAVTPAGEQAGQFPFLVRATGGPEPVEAQLGVEITGSYSLELNTAEGRLNARVTVGSGAPLTLLVTNTGTAPLAGVSLSATPPSGWEVDFEPATIEMLQPGAAASQTVTATIRTADNAVAGDYAVTLRANASDPTGGSASSSVEIRTTVETSPLWGFVGLAIIALVLAGLFLVFRQYGRR